MKLDLAFQDGKQQFEPGETLVVEASWEVGADTSGLEVHLLWFTRGKGDQDVEVVRTVPVEFPARSGSKRITFQLPREPWSFSGKLISLVWAVELVALPSGAADRKEFVMAPGATEILLHASGGQAGATG